MRGVLRGGNLNVTCTLVKMPKLFKLPRRILSPPPLGPLTNPDLLSMQRVRKQGSVGVGPWESPLHGGRIRMTCFVQGKGLRDTVGALLSPLWGGPAVVVSV